ncbi:MAG: hypothetical protein ACREO5_09550, partial [Candidatus Binatia bacterium]
MLRNHRIVIVCLILAVTLGCGLFSNSTGGTEVVLGATEVGTPVGAATTKSIGPSGGSLATPDGRMTLTVPPNAVSEAVDFSIQPVTNQSGNGIGNSYKLEPSGKTFATPLELSIHYDDNDLIGTVPNALSLAYQDEKRAWHLQKSAKLDKDRKVLTISTTHFSIWSFLSRVRITPVESKLHKSESQYIELTICGEPGWVGKLFGKTGKCESVSWNDLQWEVEGAGTIVEAGKGVIYTAPDYKPVSSTAHVFASFDYEEWNEQATTKAHWKIGATITIIGPGYKASGGDGPITYSGTICSLEKPFMVTASQPGITHQVSFVPTNATSGKMSYGTVVGPMSMNG